MPQGRAALKYRGEKLYDGTFAVVETSEFDVEKRKSDFMTPILKDVGEGKRNFFMADTDAIVDPACVIPDIGGPENRYFVVLPRNQWTKKFVEWVREEHRCDEMDNLDEDENESEEDEEESEEDVDEEEEELDPPTKSPVRKRRK